MGLAPDGVVFQIDAMIKAIDRPVASHHVQHKMYESYSIVFQRRDCTRYRRHRVSDASIIVCHRHETK
ncbi:hypothetical protein XI09_14285 [Bradyrhizobium sp. CCBAU 11386]|nr:hypothetical protein [Bradyrhizobium sp. CCBAU 11386]